MNNASKGRCVTITPSGKAAAIFPAGASKVKQKRGWKAGHFCANMVGFLFPPNGGTVTVPSTSG